MTNKRPKAKPLKLTTSRMTRNIVALCIIMALLLGGITLHMLQKMSDANNAQEDEPVVTDVQDEQPTSKKTAQEAEKIIKRYYTALAYNDSSSLHSIGNEAAASAIERGWLSSIGYSVDASKATNPDAQALPQRCGTYAGCDAYNISDFYSSDTSGAITSDVTGVTGCTGWIYYDEIKTEWIIADPTIPTSISSAEAPNVERSSLDSMVTVKMSSPGAYCNQWWAYTQLSVDISNASSDNDVTVSAKKLDKGMTTNVPSELTSGVPRTPTGTSSDGSTVSSANAVCTVYRGETSNFNMDRIGGDALSIDGNICPVSIIYGDEDVSPVFTIGSASSDDVEKLLSSEQIKRYGATSNTGR